MEKTPKKVHNVKVTTEIKAKEILEGKVAKFGAGGAHIIFSSKYVGWEVVVIPIKNANGKD